MSGAQREASELLRKTSRSLKEKPFSSLFSAKESTLETSRDNSARKQRNNQHREAPTGLYLRRKQKLLLFASPSGQISISDLETLPAAFLWPPSYL